MSQRKMALRILIRLIPPFIGTVLGVFLNDIITKDYQYFIAKAVSLLIAYVVLFIVFYLVNNYKHKQDDDHTV